MSQCFIQGLAVFGAMAAIAWWVWVSIAASCISELQEQIIKNRDKSLDKQGETLADIAMLEQRIIRLEKGKTK